MAAAGNAWSAIALRKIAATVARGSAIGRARHHERRSQRRQAGYACADERVPGPGAGARPPDDEHGDDACQNPGQHRATSYARRQDAGEERAENRTGWE